MELRKWKNVELNNNLALLMKQKLKEMSEKDKDLKYETSGAYNLTHFEVFVTDKQAGELNDFLDKY